MPKNNSDFIDIGGVLSQYKRKWYYFVISVVLFGIVGALFALSRNDIYGVRANVLIQRSSENPMSALGGGLSNLLGSDGEVDDEIFVISSHSVYRDVAKDLGLNVVHVVKPNFLKKELAFPTFPVDVVADSAVIDTLRTGISFKINVDKKGRADIKAKAKKETILDVDDAELPYVAKTPYGNFTVKMTDTYPVGKAVTTQITVASNDAAAENIAKEVKAEVANKRSNVIQMAIDTDNPVYGKMLLNEIIRKYNDRGVDLRNEQNEKTARFINERLALLAKELSDAENEVQDFKEKNGIIDVSAEAGYQTAKRGKIEEELLKAQTEAQVLRMTRDFISDDNNRFSLIPTTVENKGLQEAISNYNSLILDRLSLLQNAKPDNRALRSLEERIVTMRDNIISSVDKVSKQSDAAVAELQRQRYNTQSTLSNVPAQERAYINLLRQQQVKNTLFTYLLQRREETQILLANAVAKGQVVDEAYTLSKPISMSRKILLAIFLLIGLCVPPVLIYIQRVLKIRISEVTDVTSKLDVPVLGEISQSRAGRTMVVGPDSNSSTAELFRLMRSNLQFILGNTKNSVVLVTSTMSGEGKSFISINLAASLAMLGKKVLLMGMDIRLPRLAEYLDIKSTEGLTSYLTSDMTLESIITHDVGVAGLDVIIAGPKPPNPSEILMSEKIDNLFADVREKYDYIIVDSAPVGMVSDTFSLNRVADATIYVTRIGVTKISDINFIDEIHSNNRLNNLTVVINGTPQANNRYGYGYGSEN